MAFSRTLVVPVGQKENPALGRAFPFGGLWVQEWFKFLSDEYGTF
ncbi:MAG: hypothetical protein ACR2O0_00615 [Rhizobiaceae bacterium]